MTNKLKERKAAPRLVKIVDAVDVGRKGTGRGKEARRTPPRRVCYSLHDIFGINLINSVPTYHDAVVTTTGHSSPRLYVSLCSSHRRAS